MRDGSERAGPFDPRPGPRQGAPGHASDENTSTFRVLSVLGGPLARAGPHCAPALRALRNATRAAASRAPIHAPRTARGASPYTRPGAAAGGAAAGGAMGSGALALRLVERIYDAAVRPERWQIVLEELSAALGDA